MIEVGDKVRWSSQSNGSRTTKEGYVIALVEIGDNPKKYIPDGVSGSCIKCDGITTRLPKVLVAVKNEGSRIPSTLHFYYAPNMKNVEEVN